MLYRKTNQFDQFQCIAGDCPETCCAGWQIMIDEDSLAHYREEKGPFQERLQKGINFREACFRQRKGRCSMLNPEGLCDLYTNLGPEALCNTCRDYPRHTEEFEGEREYSLSLSCPEVARMLLTNPGEIHFLEWEDEAEEEFEDFDYLLYDKLYASRDLLFRIAQNRKMSLERRMLLILEMAGHLQDCVDEGDLFAMDEITAEEAEETIRMIPDGKIVQDAVAHFPILYELEMLHADRYDRLEVTRNYLLGPLGSKLMEAGLQLTEEEQVCGERLLMFFLYTYYLGAVYDDMVYSKAALSVYSVLWILLDYRAAGPGMDSLIRVAYSYAREIEHSDLNLDALEDYFAGQ